MADKEEQLTPEEKLLKVIQEGGEDESSSSGGDVADEESATVSEVETPMMQPMAVPVPTSEDIAAAAAEEAPPADASVAESAAAAKTDEKSKLRLARKQKKDKVEAPADQEVEAAADPGLIAAGPIVSKKNEGAGVLGLGMINRCLVALVLIMIGFAAYEIWASIQMLEPKRQASIDTEEFGWLLPVPQGADVVFEDVLKAFNEKSIIGVHAAEAKPPDAGRKVEVTTAVEVYAKKNLNLIGLSDDEAIVVDIKEDKMHFLKVGDQLTIDGTDVDVTRVTAEYVMISQGEKEIKIE